MFGTKTKKEFVSCLLAEPGIAQNFINPDVEKIYHLIWFNPLNPNSYRLTQFAFSILNKKYPVYSYSLDNMISNRTLLDLEKNFKFPYYLHGRKQISIFTDNDAVFIELLGGNILEYLTKLAKQS